MSRHHLSLWAVVSKQARKKVILVSASHCRSVGSFVRRNIKGSFKKLSRSLSLSLFSSGTYSLRTSPLVDGPICQAAKPVALGVQRVYTRRKLHEYVTGM